MMTTSARAALAALVLLSLGIGPGAMAADEPAVVTAKAAFDRLKSLEGEWKSANPGHPEGKVVYKVTAAGTTVMESLGIGTNHEMVTMYHLDGEEWKATHYCAAGNQPHLKLDRKGSKPDFYSFVFDGGTNLNPDKDMHIHAVRFKFLEGGKVESEWDGYLDGKLANTLKIPMSRP